MRCLEGSKHLLGTWNDSEGIRSQINEKLDLLIETRGPREWLGEIASFSTSPGVSANMGRISVDSPLCLYFPRCASLSLFLSQKTSQEVCKVRKSSAHFIVAWICLDSSPGQKFYQITLLYRNLEIKRTFWTTVLEFQLGSISHAVIILWCNVSISVYRLNHSQFFSIHLLSIPVWSKLIQCTDIRESSYTYFL